MPAWKTIKHSNFVFYTPVIYEEGAIKPHISLDYSLRKRLATICDFIVPSIITDENITLVTHNKITDYAEYRLSPNEYMLSNHLASTDYEFTIGAVLDYMKAFAYQKLIIIADDQQNNTEQYLLQEVISELSDSEIEIQYRSLYEFISLYQQDSFSTEKISCIDLVLLQRCVT